MRAAIRAVFASPSIDRIFRNAGKLLRGKAIAGLLSLAYLGIAARSLGPQDMGALVLAHAYAMTIAGVMRFQSWQAVIRFGVPMIADNKPADFRALMRFTIRLDVLTGAAAMALAALGVPLAARLFHWSDEVTRVVYVYCLAVPGLIAATPTGILRLFGRFELLSLQLTLMPAVRLAGALTLWALGGGAAAFIAVWILSAFANGASLWILGLRDLRRRGLMPDLLAPSEAPTDRAWLPFMIKTNLSSTIDMVHGSLPVLIVGAVLGSAAASFLQIAINATNVLAHPTNMLNQATYPELAEAANSRGRKEMVALTFRSILIAIAFASPVVLTFVFFSGTVVTLIAGAHFLPAAPIVALMAVSQPLRIASVMLDSAVLARGHAGASLAAQVVSAIVHLGALAILLPLAGVIGAPIALMLGRTSMIALLGARVVSD